MEKMNGYFSCSECYAKANALANKSEELGAMYYELFHLELKECN